MTDKQARIELEALRKDFEFSIANLATGWNEIIKTRDDKIASLETTNLLLMAHYGLEEVELEGTPAVPATPAKRVIRKVEKKR